MVSEVGLLMAWMVELTELGDDGSSTDGAGGPRVVSLTASQAGRADGAGGRQAVGLTASQLVELGDDGQ